MKTGAKLPEQGGSALVFVLLMLAAGLLILGSVMDWSSNEARMTQRRTQRQGASGAAEAATERVVAQISRDFQTGGSNLVDANLSSYTSLIPDPLRTAFSFSSPGSATTPVKVQRLLSWSYTNLQATLPGLSGRAATYRVSSFAQQTGSSQNPTTGVQQDIQLAYIPVFQFGVFYGMDLEMIPSVTWTVTGRVHANGNVYCDPNNVTLTFADALSATGSILLQRSPDDPVSKPKGTVVFSGERLPKVRSLNLPIGTNNSDSALHAIIDIPPAGESASSALGQQRLYNQAELIIRITESGGTATSGAYNNFSVVIPWSTISDSAGTKSTTIVFPDRFFWDMREGTYIEATDVDVARLISNYAYYSGLVGRNIKTIYVADVRTNLYYVPGARLINGQAIPSQGLTLVTPQPLYVKGHFNAPSSALGTTNTTATYPAALIADAVTFLSTSWNDNYSYWGLSSRVAANTTFNAAVLTGIVASDGSYSSGGAQNAIRLLENWNSRTLTYNGSLVVLFTSQTATAPWGATSGVYREPTRRFNRDWNFQNPAKLPAGTPELRTNFRANWTVLAPSTTS